MKGFTVLEMIIVLCIVGLLAVIGHEVVERARKNNTDSPSQRSGMTLHTDYGTGCQYLTVDTGFGVAMTPRRGADGKQICGRQE